MLETSWAFAYHDKLHVEHIWMKYTCKSLNCIYTVLCSILNKKKVEYNEELYPQCFQCLGITWKFTEIIGYREIINIPSRSLKQQSAKWWIRKNNQNIISTLHRENILCRSNMYLKINLNNCPPPTPSKSNIWLIYIQLHWPACWHQVVTRHYPATAHIDLTHGESEVTFHFPRLHWETTHFRHIIIFYL